MPELVAEVRRGKALAHVVESATVKDGAGDLVELKTLQPDGTYADPAELEAGRRSRRGRGSGGQHRRRCRRASSTGEYLDAPVEDDRRRRRECATR